MKSFLVIGLGRFGSHLAKNLAALGNEVMAIDRDEEKVLQITPFVTAAQVGDCQEEGAMDHLGVANFDVCFVCINDDFQGSLEVTWALKEQGARYVVARADRERQIKFLKRIGADQVVHTEKDMASRVAVKYSAPNAFDYIEITSEYVILEIETPGSWVGHTAVSYTHLVGAGASSGDPPHRGSQLLPPLGRVCPPAGADSQPPPSPGVLVTAPDITPTIVVIGSPVT